MAYQLLTTEVFNRWLTGVRDHQAKKAIARRLDRLAAGHFGDVKSVGEGVSEMRIFAGPDIAFILPSEPAKL